MIEVIGGVQEKNARWASQQIISCRPIRAWFNGHRHFSGHTRRSLRSVFAALLLISRVLPKKKRKIRVKKPRIQQCAWLFKKVLPFYGCLIRETD
ncbi:hypothetical protein JWJ90_18555 [Desulfobulbus rhabdoformis]|uniref:hypothetical protein n=1 Tax=Desulfobulbus rhabdoformis TaxID=34032 RepID=UPI001962CCA8|nr:hypothetical protein [Desulfobulbus rhabdoformis]MBM9616272.1 hypothetical protein [Desulfobulbus rhabdoformis]